MTERPGTSEARKLFCSSSRDEWQECYDRYNGAVISVAKAKKKPELIEHDNFIWEEFPVLVSCRKPQHITLNELSNIMKWKLARGKARPLQKLVDSNSNNDVVTASTEAIKYLRQGNWLKAINEIISLKGIGVATASAIFAALAPEIVPFMADEVLEASTTCKRAYTINEFKVMRESLLSKALDLGSEWNVEKVGKALWVQAMVAIYPSITEATTCTDPTLATAGTNITSAAASSVEAAVAFPVESQAGTSLQVEARSVLLVGSGKRKKQQGVEEEGGATGTGSAADDDDDLVEHDQRTGTTGMNITHKNAQARTRQRRK